MNTYRIFAIEYARRLAPPSDLFLRSQETEPVPMSYFVWAVVGSNGTVVVDSGFTEEVARARGRELKQSPVAGLKAIGVDPAAVEHVTVTHFHWDHMGTVPAFPKATFYAQEREMAFWTGRHAKFPAFREVVEEDDVTGMVRLGLAGRLVLCDGSREILPGITVHRVGGHTAGMQIVEVATANGKAVIASDAVKAYRHLAENIPDPFLHNIPEMLDGYELVRELAGDEGHVFPGHDPEVLERFKPAAPGVVVLE
jgi:glyoxylase-like metal-dependent hydrolase (beta-lactamase superfamily II)